MNWRILIAGAITLMLCATMAAVPSDAVEETGFDVTDGLGNTFHFDAPAEHIVTSGYAATLTVADAGEIDKIVAVDKYSTYESSGDEKLKDLDAIDLGSFYGTSNDDNIRVTLVNMVEDGTLEKEDPIILVNYDDNISLRDTLVGDGFENVLMWGEAHDYDTVIDIVRDVSLIVTGTEPESVQTMNGIISTIQDGVSDIADGDRAKALYVWYYSGEFLVGSESIMGSMLEICGAEHIGFREGVDRYGDVATIINLLEENPDAVVFVSSSYFSGGNTVADFRDDVLGGDGSIKVVEMGAQWNNCCPESADGLMAIAQSLYPEIFGEYEGVDMGSSGSGDDLPVLYIVVVIVIVVLVLAVAAVYMRRKP